MRKDITQTHSKQKLVITFLLLLISHAISAQCYKSNLDVGKQQYNSGKYQTAMTTFQKSLKCPDAKGGSEAKEMIEKCKEKLNDKKTEAPKINNKEKVNKEQSEKELREKIEKELRVKIEQEMKEKSEKERTNRIEQDRKIAEQVNLKIGDSFAGGIIFYLDYTEKHGKVCAAKDQSRGAKWEDAKLICSNLTLNGYSDWHLPTLDELNDIYENLHLKFIGGFSKEYYWSSSLYDQINVWVQNFANSEQYYQYTASIYYVRAVRSF